MTESNALADELEALWSHAPSIGQLADWLSANSDAIITALRATEPAEPGQVMDADRLFASRLDSMGLLSGVPAVLDCVEAAAARHRQGRAEAEAEIVAWPELLTPELRHILGMMCFQLGKLAHAYQRASEFIGVEGPLDKRAEDEQAFMLHKWIGFWFSHGAEWQGAAGADLTRVIDAIERGEHKEPKP